MGLLGMGIGLVGWRYSGAHAAEGREGRKMGALRTCERVMSPVSRTARWHAIKGRSRRRNACAVTCGGQWPTHRRPLGGGIVCWVGDGVDHPGLSPKKIKIKILGSVEKCLYGGLDSAVRKCT
jgi:hypothetical protein